LVLKQNRRPYLIPQHQHPPKSKTTTSHRISMSLDSYQELELLRSHQNLRFGPRDSEALTIFLKDSKRVLPMILLPLAPQENDDLRDTPAIALALNRAHEDPL